MKPPAWLLPLVLTVAALAAVFAFLRPAASVSTVGGMSSTLTKPRATKTARKAAVRRSVTKKSPAPLARLPLPPGPSAAEFFANLPPPAKNFDAEGVERIVALRASR